MSRQSKNFRLHLLPPSQDGYPVSSSATRIKFLGQGSFGKVYLIDHPTYGPCAMKTVANNEIALREIRVLQYLSTRDCPWNMRLYDYERDPDSDTLVLFTENFDGFPLNDLKFDMSADGQQARWMFLAMELIRAVKCLHSVGVVHRDIKPQNILFDGDSIKLIDFGMACVLDECPVAAMGTLEFTAPEAIRNVDPKNFVATDIWALGVTLFYMAYDRVLFSSLGSSAEVVQALDNIRAGKVTVDSFFTKFYPKKIRALLLSLLEADPERRVRNFEAMH